MRQLCSGVRAANAETGKAINNAIERGLIKYNSHMQAKCYLAGIHKYCLCIDFKKTGRFKIMQGSEARQINFKLMAEFKRHVLSPDGREPHSKRWIIEDKFVRKSQKVDDIISSYQEHKIESHMKQRRLALNRLKANDLRSRKMEEKYFRNTSLTDTL